MLTAQDMGMTGNDYVFIMSYYLTESVLEPLKGWENESDPAKLANLRSGEYSTTLIQIEKFNFDSKKHLSNTFMIKLDR